MVPHLALLLSIPKQRLHLQALQQVVLARLRQARGARA
jgi:hypothetical protein